MYISAGHQTLSQQLSNVSISSSGLGDGKSTGPRIKAKKSRGVGISAEPQTLQNLKVPICLLEFELNIYIYLFDKQKCVKVSDIWFRT